MATVARLLPRDWDGRRLLQFLTGLALIVLAFALPALQGPAAEPADPPVTIVTTVDTPLSPDLPLVELPAPTGSGPHRAGLVLSLTTTDSETGTARGAVIKVPGAEPSAHRAAGAGGVAGTDPRATERIAHGTGSVHGAAAMQGLMGLPVQVWQDGRRICVEAAAAVSGVSQRAHSQRGPPRA